MVVTRRGVFVSSSDKPTAETSNDTEAMPPVTRKTRAAALRDDVESDATSDSQHNEGPCPSKQNSAVKRRVRLSKQQKSSATTPGSTHEADASESESVSGCESVPSPATQQQRTRSQKNTPALAKRDNKTSEVSRLEGLSERRITRSHRKATLTSQVEESDLSEADSCSSSMSGLRRSSRIRKAPVHLGYDAESTPTAPRPTRASANKPTSYDSEGFESGPSRTPQRFAGLQAAVRKPDDGLTDSESESTLIYTPLGSPGSVKGKTVSHNSSQVPVKDLTASLEEEASAAEAGLQEHLQLSMTEEQDNTLITEISVEKEHSESYQDVTQDESSKVDDEVKGDVNDVSKPCNATCPVSEGPTGIEEVDRTQQHSAGISGSKWMENKDLSINIEAEGEMDNIFVEKGDDVVNNIQTGEPHPFQKPSLFSLLVSSDEENESENDDSGEEALGETEVYENQAGTSKSRPSADGLFVIDTQPGHQSDSKYYLGEECEEQSSEVDEGKRDDDEFIDEEGEEDDGDDEILFKSKNSALVLSSSIDPGFKVRELGGLYINFDGKTKSISEEQKQVKDQKRQDMLLKKSVIGPDFEKKESVPPYVEAKRVLKLKRREQREMTTGEGWFNMKAPELTEELKNDLQVLKMRGAMDPKRFYKKNDRDGFPKYFQVGTVVDNPVDFYHARVPKKQRKRTIVEELLADAEFRSYNKKKYQQIISEKAAEGAGRKNRKLHKYTKKAGKRRAVSENN